MATQRLAIRLTLPKSSGVASALRVDLRIEDVPAGGAPTVVLGRATALDVQLAPAATQVDLTIDVDADALAKADMPTIWAHVRAARRAEHAIMKGDLVAASSTDPRVPGADGRLLVTLREVT